MYTSLNSGPRGGLETRDPRRTAPMHLRGSASQAHRAHAFAVGRRSEHSRTRCARREDHPGNCTGARVQFGLAPATSLCRCGRQCARGEGRRVSRAPSSRPIVYARDRAIACPRPSALAALAPTLLLFLLCPPICLLACIYMYACSQLLPEHMRHAAPPRDTSAPAAGERTCRLHRRVVHRLKWLRVYSLHNMQQHLLPRRGR